jgi:hypothetical protein
VTLPVKIDRQIAEEIRALVREGMTQKEVSYRVGLSKSTVSMIVANKVWRDDEPTGATQCATTSQPKA